MALNPPVKAGDVVIQRGDTKGMWAVILIAIPFVLPVEHWEAIDYATALLFAITTTRFAITTTRQTKGRIWRLAPDETWTQLR